MKRIQKTENSPAAMEDVRCALQYLLKNAGVMNIDPEFVKTISPVSLVNEYTPPTYIVHGDTEPIRQNQNDINSIIY